MGKNSKRNAIANKMFNKPEGDFKPIDLETAAFVPKGMTRAFSNNRYIVMIYDNSKTTHGEAISALVQKHNNTPILNHWSEMQRIKNLIFGEEVTAVEYYPKESELQDIHNIYWMWIFKNNELPIPILNK